MDKVVVYLPGRAGVWSCSHCFTYSGEVATAIFGHNKVELRFIHRSLKQLPVFRGNPRREPVFHLSIFRKNLVFRLFLLFGHFLQHGQRVAYEMRNLQQPLFNLLPHMPFAVRKAIQTRVQVGHGAA
ncbi:hypothetical protein V8G54_017922 [Vigna mungo]|uniref:Uncharacterized protein n=1 Tax=Vigna mungo TaxID=3915 RepID=A0AAQ3RUA6_VIGMU